MTAGLIIAGFLAADVAAVIGALVWLSSFRARQDVTDLRYRRRYR